MGNLAVFLRTNQGSRLGGQWPGADFWYPSMRPPAIAFPAKSPHERNENWHPEFIDTTNSYLAQRTTADAASTSARSLLAVKLALNAGRLM